MAPELRAVATEATRQAVSLSRERASPSPTRPPSPRADAADTLSRSNSNPLKRPRENNPASTTPPAPKSARAGLRTSASSTSLNLNGHRKDQAIEARDFTLPVGKAQPGNGIAIRQSEDAAMSRPSDKPSAAPAPDAAPTAPTETSSASKVSPTITIPPATSTAPGADGNVPRSPQSATSGTANTTGIAGAAVTASPTAMDVDPPKEDESQQRATQQEKTTPGSLSYPGPLHMSGSMPAPPSRGMSYPMPSSGQTSPTSGAAKKHKCPYCETVFTRHHNLKSHLLTHSQEKPYVCQQCDLRFRRLHDLKRHGKLHTGEKPHVCPKCERKFARGDALARHSKGAGGCAGRRSSMGGSLADDDGTGEGDDTAMSGVSYDESVTDEERRRTLPSIKAQHVTNQNSNHSNTYPPARGPQRAATTGGLFPPSSSSTTTSPSMPTNSTGSGHTPSTSISSMPPMSAGSGSMYSQAMTESPKPLSPAISGQPGAQQDGILGRQRSPSGSAQFSRDHFSRRPSGRGHTPPHIALPANRPNKLPALASIAPQESRYGMAKGSRGGSQAVEHIPNSLSADLASLWAYVHTLEERVAEMETRDKSQQSTIMTLSSEVADLKRQIDVAGAAPATARTPAIAPAPALTPARAPPPASVAAAPPAATSAAQPSAATARTTAPTPTATPAVATVSK